MHPKFHRSSRAALFACALLSSAIVPSYATTQPADVVSAVGDSAHWTGRKWSADDAALFGGMPLYRGTHKDIILLRYSFFASNYDTEQLSPLWVAHVDHAGALAMSMVRTNGHDMKWGRPSAFFTDNNVIAFSKAHHRPYVVQDSYTNCNPRELPSGIGSPIDITRGHNASNDEMKLAGDETESIVSQHESFSLANISPQMQAHNAPMWAALENDCLEWAGRLGKVAVITGPVFSPDPKLPAPVNRILYTNGKKGPQIPIPTHFFKIIIGKIDGKNAAVGFLVPHLSTLKKDGYKGYAVPISEIEKVTQLTFFPLGQSPPDKNQVDHRWLDLLSAN